MPPADGKPRLPGSLHLNRRLSQWLSFHADGRVTITPGKVELGQGILTTLSQIAADELDVAFGRITARPAATPDSPDEAVTSGSLSTQDSGGALRHACAAARAIFTQVVAQRTGVPVEIDHASRTAPSTARPGRSAATGNSPTRRCWTCEATPEARAKPARRAASPAPRSPASTCRTRCSAPPATCTTCAAGDAAGADGAAAGAARGAGGAAATARCRAMRRVVRDGSFLAVLARDGMGCRGGGGARRRRAPSWDGGGHAAGAGAARGLAARCRDARRAHRRGARRASRCRPRARWRAASSGPIWRMPRSRPSCAVARWEGDGGHRLDPHARAPTTCAPTSPRRCAARRTKVVVRHSEGAGCYGHNGADDVALDAVLAARAVPGVPVRMLWSRAEELGWSPFSPAMLVDVEADLDAAGNIAAWRSHIVSNGHSSRPGRAPEPTLLSASMLAEPFR